MDAMYDQRMVQQHAFQSWQNSSENFSRICRRSYICMSKEEKVTAFDGQRLFCSDLESPRGNENDSAKVKFGDEGHYKIKNGFIQLYDTKQKIGKLRVTQRPTWRRLNA
ncbi:hypothetical protein O6H91_12G061100 [Diphasiastrum complanatum]|uniref:Uncharacterized protein n=2 Tax=Diphasiastrum complanatum TaxID=34168 RepID=A0ACC2C2S4_DIPCM|nr:hypothetical protein O6H91_12G060800 [Diphasiastrum complanatum]KAJ7536233.1 hypothetical protein O6H91_12G061100 [Diphasiastrum complanatum]